MAVPDHMGQADGTETAGATGAALSGSEKVDNTGLYILVLDGDQEVRRSGKSWRIFF